MKQSELIRIKLSKKGDEDRLLQFHEDNLTPHLFKRDSKFFQKLISANRVFEAVVEHADSTTKDIVGMCYIMNDKELCGASRHEFGGVVVLSRYEGTGLASALATIALSHTFVYEPPVGRIVSHIHEKNSLPLKLFVKYLFFLRIGFELMPAKVVEISKMAVNERGLLIGDLYFFEQVNFNKYAIWLRHLSDNNFVIKTPRMTIELYSNLLILSSIQDGIVGLEQLAAANNFNKSKHCWKCGIFGLLDKMKILWFSL